MNEYTEKTIALYLGTSAVPIKITLNIPDSRDAEEYIDDLLDGLLNDSVKYNSEWEFV